MAQRVGVDLSAFQGVDAKVGIKPSNSGNSTISFTGPDAITFGFAVQQIAREGDEWTLHGVAPSGDIAFAVSGIGAGQGSECTNPHSLRHRRPRLPPRDLTFILSSCP